MDTKPHKQRRLSSFLEHVVHKSDKHIKTKNTSSQPPSQNVESRKKGSILRRLSRGVLHWRNGRNKVSRIHIEKDTHETSDVDLSKVIIEIHEDVGKKNTDSTDDHTELHTKNIGGNDVVVSVEVTGVDGNGGEDDGENNAHDNFTISPEGNIALANEITASSVPDNKTEVVQPAPEAPFGMIKCVYRRDRKTATQFATSKIHVSLSSSPLEAQVFWTDASKKEAHGRGQRGGISVAQKQGQHWKVEYAHVVGLERIEQLEGLAILTALEMALQTCPGGGLVFIFSDSKEALLWLEKALLLFLAMEKATREFQTTKCYSRTLVSFYQAFGFQSLDRYPGAGFKSTIW